MAGGLIQIASYGIHDIYLIGNPQITFFKTVYKKHCNFSMEYLEELFNSNTNFGNEFSMTITKTGDLLHKLYLKIVIPQVLINKKTYGTLDIDNNTFYTQFNASYKKIIEYINSINYNIVQPLFNLIKITNIKYSEINQKYTSLYNKLNYSNLLSTINQIQISFDNSFSIPLIIQSTNKNIIDVNIPILITNILDFNQYYTYYIKSNSITVLNDLNRLLLNYTTQLKIIKQNLHEQLIVYTKLHNTIQRENINFAWVEYLGHQIINRVELEIGGKLIDFTDAVRLNLNHQLTSKIMHEQTYNKLLGNVPELTTFNSDIKPSYIMYIPLEFWFAKYSGLSIPLIYLRYHDVKINVKLNNLINCCYFEQLNSNIFIEDIIKIDNVSLILNYIYLDTDERKKFAQLTHEYLIDQTQIINYTDISTNKINFEIPFYNPIKQLFWLARDTNNIKRLRYFDYSSSYYVDIYKFHKITLFPKSLSNYRKNIIQIETTEINLSTFLKIGDEISILNSIYYNGTYKVLLIDRQYIYIDFSYFIQESYINNYQLINNSYVQLDTYIGNTQAFIYKVNNSNPISTSSLELNSISLFKDRDSLYNNFVQPYQHNSRSPSYGLNTYSFALQPEEHQPNGFCNFNKLDLITMYIKFDPQYISNTIIKKIDILVYAHSYNILQFTNGKAKIIFNL
jgi:hypothetical protein